MTFVKGKNNGEEILNINRIFYFLFLLVQLVVFPARAEIISQDRRIEWSPGIPDGYPEKFFEIDVMQYGATGDGKTNDTNAFISALNVFPADGGVLYIPEGDFLIKSQLNITKGVLLRGEGEKTRLYFDLGGSTDACIFIYKSDRGQWSKVMDGCTKGSNKIIVQDAKLFQPNDFVEIQQANDPDLMYTQNNWNQSWAQNAVGQILIVKNVIKDTLVFNKKLYMNYRQELNPVIRTIGMITYPGVEDLYIERLDAGDGSTIYMQYAAYAVIQRIESAYTFRGHVNCAQIYGCEIRNNYLHHAHDYGDGGHGYGIVMSTHATDNLIIDNILFHLRHALITSVGASGNVYAYNFSTQRQATWFCDVSLHGHYGNYSLYESNVVEEIDISDYWGPMGPGNTFLRNKVTVAGIDLFDYSHDQNLVGNYLPVSEIDISSGIEGTLAHGNYYSGHVHWDESIEDHTIPVSFFLDSKPDFFQELSWPAFGPDVGGDNKIPAQIRYENGNPISSVKNCALQSSPDVDLVVFPNPFNEHITISYKNPAAAHVELTIYNILGEKVTTLVDENQVQGNHSVLFHTVHCSSGIYICKLKIGDILYSKKISLGK